MTHTKGPWKVTNLDGQTFITPDRGKSRYALIAKVHGPDGSKAANSHLITLAPEMKERLEETRDQLANLLKFAGVIRGTSARASVKGTIAQIDALLSKL